MALATLETAVHDFCRTLGLSDRLAMVERAWSAEMGSWGSMATLVAIDNAALVVEVSSSPALQEISLRRKELIRRLNRHFGQPFIQNIHVKIARQ